MGRFRSPFLKLENMSKKGSRNGFLNGDLTLCFCVPIECWSSLDNCIPSEENSLFLQRKTVINTALNLPQPLKPDIVLKAFSLLKWNKAELILLSLLVS